MKLGLDVIMLTGDNELTAQAIARDAGIVRVLADVRPDEKAAQVRKLQAEGKLVAIVGDGARSSCGCGRSGASSPGGAAVSSRASESS